MAEGGSLGRPGWWGAFRSGKAWKAKAQGGSLLSALSQKEDAKTKSSSEHDSLLGVFQAWQPRPPALMRGDPTAQVNGGFEERKPHVFCFLPILYSLQSVSHPFEEGLSLFYREDLRFRDGKWLTQGRGSALWQSHYISALPTDFYPNTHSHCWGQRSNGIFPKKSPWRGIKSGE